MELLLPLAVAFLFTGAFWCLMQPNLAHLALGLLLLSNAANLTLFGARGLTRALPPLLDDKNLPGSIHADPLPQALILTAIVIGMGVLAFTLALLRRLHNETGLRDFSELEDQE